MKLKFHFCVLVFSLPLSPSRGICYCSLLFMICPETMSTSSSPSSSSSKSRSFDSIVDSRVTSLIHNFRRSKVKTPFARWIIKKKPSDSVDLNTVAHDSALDIKDSQCVWAKVTRVMESVGDMNVWAQLSWITKRNTRVDIDNTYLISTGFRESNRTEYEYWLSRVKHFNLNKDSGLIEVSLSCPPPPLSITAFGGVCVGGCRVPMCNTTRRSGTRNRMNQLLVLLDGHRRMIA